MFRFSRLEFVVKRKSRTTFVSLKPESTLTAEPLVSQDEERLNPAGLYLDVISSNMV